MAERDARWVPGEDVGYHPLNFGWILGEVVRRVDGRTLGRFVADEITGPLGLRDTYVGLPPERDAEVAHLVDLSGESAFVSDFNRPEVHAVQCGAATGISTTDDLTRFYTMLLRGGALDGVRLVQPETIARATSSRSCQRSQVSHFGPTGTPPWWLSTCAMVALSLPPRPNSGQ